MSFWSQERENALRIGVDRGLSASAIAALLGCSRNAVIGKARRSGMKLHGAALGSGMEWATASPAAPRARAAKSPTAALVAALLIAATAAWSSWVMPPPVRGSG